MNNGGLFGGLEKLNSIDCGGQALFNNHVNPSNSSDFNIDPDGDDSQNNLKNGDSYKKKEMIVI
jgi:hypothetical protein